jgi:hypothetical protein
MRPQEAHLNIRRTYLMAKALNYQIVWLRDKVEPDVKKILNEAKAKNSHLIQRFENTLSTDARKVLDDVSFELLDEIWDKFKVTKDTQY